MEGYTGLKTGPLLTFRSEEERDIAYVPASWGEGFSAAIVDSLMGSPGPLAWNFATRQRANIEAENDSLTAYALQGAREQFEDRGLDPGPAPRMLTAEEAQAKYGIGDLKFDGPISDEAARNLFDTQRMMLKRQDVIRRSEISGFDIFIASLGGAALDPLSVAAGVFPAVGLSRAGLAVERAASLGGRIGRGALEGAVSSAALTPLTYALSQSQQRPYTLSDAFLDVVFGTALGAGIHAGIGAFQRWQTRGERMPGMQQVVQEMPLADQEMMLRGAVASIMEGRPVTLDPLLLNAVEELRAARAGVTRIAREEDALLRRSQSADEAASIKARIAELERERTQLDAEIAAAAARGEPDAVTEARMRAIDDEMWAPGTTRARKAELGAEFQMITEGASPEANLDMLRAQAEATGLRAERGRVEGRIGALQSRARTVDQVRRSFLQSTGKLASKRSIVQAMAERTLARMLGRESQAMRPEIANAARNILSAPKDQAAAVIARELSALKENAANLGGLAARGERGMVRGATMAPTADRRQVAMRGLVRGAAEPYYDATDLSGIEADDLRLKEQPAVKADAVAGEATPDMRELDALTAELEEDMRGLDQLGVLNDSDKAYVAEADELAAKAQLVADARATAAICLAS